MPPRVAAFPCCRSHDLFAPVEEYAAHVQRTPGDEAYWFNWDSSFNGTATIRIARLGCDLAAGSALGPHGDMYRLLNRKRDEKGKGIRCLCRGKSARVTKGLLSVVQKDPRLVVVQFAGYGAHQVPP